MNQENSLDFLPEDWNRALAIVAHPDDLEYGAASAVARWTSQGKEVKYLLVTRGEAGIDTIPPEQAGPAREQEERNGAQVVGVSSVDFLDYGDGVVPYDMSLRHDLARAIRIHRPETVISLNFRLSWGGPSFNMADHRHVGLATLDAVRDAANRWIFRDLLGAGLEPWKRVRMVCFSGSPSPTHGVDVTDFIDRGVASLREHALYLQEFKDFDADSFLRNAARGAGERMGCELATTFEVLQM